MALPTHYDTGTVTVANGGTIVTGVGTGWKGKVYAGDLFTDPAQGLFARVTADATSDTSLSIKAWPGTDLTADAYEILITPDTARVQERTRQLLEQVSVVDANGRGLFFRFSAGTADADPGEGYLRFNHATIGSATAAYLDNLDADGASVAAILDTWDDTGAAGNRGQLWVRAIASPDAFHAFTVTGSVVDGTGYRKLALTYIGGAGTLEVDDGLMGNFVPVGPVGPAGNDGKFSGSEVVKTAAYTALAADVGKTIILNKATADTLSFDPAATLGATWIAMVKNIGVGTWSLDPDGTETIDGAATISLAQNESVVISCNGTALRSFFRGSLTEEGTFTPVVEGTSTAGAGTYSQQTGIYTKIGRLVFFEITVSWSAHTGTGNIKIAGLPFAAGATPASRAVSMLYSTLTYSGDATALISAGQTSISPRVMSSGNSTAEIAMDTSATMVAQGFYSI